MAEFLDTSNKNGGWIIDIQNKNNHAGVERREASERAEALLKLINEYRVYSHRFEKELFNKFGGDVENGEIDKLRNEYFMVVGKKPFMAWGVEDLKKRIEDFKENPVEISEKTLHSKKSRWGK